MHLLRAAHQPRQDRFREGGSQGARWRDPDRLPGYVPDGGDHFREYQRSEQPGSGDEKGKDELWVAGGFEYQAAHDLSSGVAQPESGDRRMKMWGGPPGLRGAPRTRFWRAWTTAAGLESCPTRRTNG